MMYDTIREFVRVRGKFYTYEGYEKAVGRFKNRNQGFLYSIAHDIAGLCAREELDDYDMGGYLMGDLMNNEELARKVLETEQDIFANALKRFRLKPNHDIKGLPQADTL